MDVYEASLSTRQAAEILFVHESSVKRWCNSGELRCAQTEGGHRRIDLTDVLAFARERSMEAPLVLLGDEAEATWKEVVRARKLRDYTGLAGRVRSWLDDGETDKTILTIKFLRSLGIDSSCIFDQILSPALHSVGEDWETARITIGDEHRILQAARDAVLFAQSPHEGRATPKAPRKAVVGCVSGEQHEMGAYLTRMLLHELGWDVVYLGLNVPASEFAGQQARFRASLVCVSALPPQGPQSLRRAIVQLAQLYDASLPYRLAVGGPGVDKAVSPQTLLPFEDLGAFHNLTDFREWIA